MDNITQNEPIAAQRNVTVALLSPSTGLPVSGVSGTTIMVAQPGANFVAAVAGDVVEITAGGVSLYKVQLAQSEVQNVGDVLVTVAKSGTIMTAATSVAVKPATGLYYGLGRVSGANTLVLGTDAAAVDSTYAGTGAGCVARIVAGTCAGQARRATAYVGSSRTLTVPIAWVGGPPDATSVILIQADTGQLDPSSLAQILGLHRANSMLDGGSGFPTVQRNGRGLMTVGRLRVFANATALAAAVAGHADAADSETYRYTVSGIDNGAGLLGQMTMTQVFP